MIEITDFHTHILPGIDDGSRSTEDSLAMLRMEMEQGIHHVVLTPHFYPQSDKPERFLARRAAAVERLEEALRAEAGLPEITVGAEMHYFRGIGSIDILPEFTVGSGKYLLVEMPSAPWTDAMFRDLEDIYSKKNIIPIIAHIDRYISPFRIRRVMERLEELPVLIQANSEFFLRRNTSRMALKMLRQGQIHLLGSDCHNLSSRKPDLGEAVERIVSHLGEEPLRNIMDCQSRIISELQAIIL